LETHHVVLYLHLLSLFIGIGTASILLVCIFQLRSAETLADAIPWGRVAGKIGRAFPIAVLGLFATGAYMTSDVWTWDTGWIAVSIAGLAVVTLQGPIVAERTAHKLAAALQENGPGPLGEHARRNDAASGPLDCGVHERCPRAGHRLEHDAEAWDRERNRHARRRVRRRCGGCAVVLAGTGRRARRGTRTNRVAGDGSLRNARRKGQGGPGATATAPRVPLPQSDRQPGERKVARPTKVHRPASSSVSHWT
jgi:hypothetical protein